MGLSADKEVLTAETLKQTFDNFMEAMYLHYVHFGIGRCQGCPQCKHIDQTRRLAEAQYLEQMTRWLKR